MSNYKDQLKINSQNLYEILGLEGECEKGEIRLAYKKKLLEHHPDKSKNSRTTVDQIQYAYNTLFDEDLRKKYDANLRDKEKDTEVKFHASGVEVYTLEDFKEMVSENETYYWEKDCPRCFSTNSFRLEEKDLEENDNLIEDGAYEIIIQCTSCSLWMKVRYFEVEP